jgi:hypothetical protein
MTRPELKLQTMADVFKQALISFRENMRVLLVIAALSSMYNNAIESSIGLVGLPFNVSHGNFSLDFDHRGKQNHSPSDSASGISQRQKHFVDGNSNAIGTGGQARQEEESSLGHFLSSYFVGPPADEANGHIHDLIHGADGNTFVGSSMETNKGQSEQVSSPQAELQGRSESTENVDDQQVFAYDDSDDTGLNYMKIRMVFLLRNDTRKEITDDLEESEEVGIFAGRLFAGRGFDHQGAMPQGTGATVFLILFLLIGVLATLLVVAALQHSAVLGAVAYTVVSTHMNKRVSIRQSVRSGLRTGIWRLNLAVLLFAGKVLELEQMERLVLRLSIMPFAFRAAWKDEYATDMGMSSRIGAFVTLDYLFDGLAYSIYITACWVAIVESQYRGAETFYRGWSLVKRMPFQAATIKVIESVICGRSFKWMLQQVVGHSLAMLIVSFLEAFFLVLWLIFYFSARSKENQGQFPLRTSNFLYICNCRNLEDFLDRIRTAQFSFQDAAKQ